MASEALVRQRFQFSPHTGLITTLMKAMAIKE